VGLSVPLLAWETAHRHRNYCLWEKSFQMQLEADQPLLAEQPFGCSPSRCLLVRGRLTLDSDRGALELVAVPSSCASPCFSAILFIILFPISICPASPLTRT
jgi:hypothetical protein